MADAELLLDTGGLGSLACSYQSKELATHLHKLSMTDCWCNGGARGVRGCGSFLPAPGGPIKIILNCSTGVAWPPFLRLLSICSTRTCSWLIKSLMLATSSSVGAIAPYYSILTAFWQSVLGMGIRSTDVGLVGGSVGEQKTLLDGKKEAAAAQLL